MSHAFTTPFSDADNTASVIALTILGPENLGQSFRVSADHDMEEAAGHDAVVRALHIDERVHRDTDSSDDGHAVDKARAEGTEVV